MLNIALCTGLRFFLDERVFFKLKSRCLTIEFQQHLNQNYFDKCTLRTACKKIFWDRKNTHFCCTQVLTHSGKLRFFGFQIFLLKIFIAMYSQCSIHQSGEKKKNDTVHHFSDNWTFAKFHWLKKQSVIRRSSSCAVSKKFQIKKAI